MGYVTRVTPSGNNLFSPNIGGHWTATQPSPCIRGPCLPKNKQIHSVRMDIMDIKAVYVGDYAGKFCGQLNVY